MAIDISRHPEDLLAEQITAMNTNLPPLTRNEINIRRVTPFTPDRWGKPESKEIGRASCRERVYAPV